MSRLKFESMSDKPEKGTQEPKSDKQSFFDPEGASKEKFRPSQIRRARSFVKKYALPSTLEFLSSTKFGSDPNFIQGALTALARAESVLGAETEGLQFDSMSIEAEGDARHDIQEMLEAELYEARSSWVQEHGRAIENAQHPLDNLESWNPDLSEGGGDE